MGGGCEDEQEPFTEEEIHAALMGMNGDKAPGPDGFTVAFWQSCWDFVKEEIVDLFKEFFDEKSFAKRGYAKEIHSPLPLCVGYGSAKCAFRRAVDGGFISGSSGLKINLAKSEVIPVGRLKSLDELAVEIGCKVGVLLLFIWGCPWEPITRPRLCGTGLK
ncbi:hypothetical protein CK203_116817 [Vitis vinifera]|uniref:Reverse transcriptase domain-containing protein n=1 Tax=Vitis vinifera TaxID=29760 RepID=A0A438CS95_VITVI|nr:hypothetical protein CK203_116817 [Vitis vinifera]